MSKNLNNEILRSEIWWKKKSQLEWTRMMGQQLYSPYKVGDHSWEKVHAAQKNFM